MRRILPVLFAAALMLFTACDGIGTDAGSFTVVFSWTEGDKPDSFAGLSVWARLERWPGGDDTQAEPLALAGPATLDTTLDFGELTYGGDRVVIAEIRRGAAKDSPLAYTGRSALFTLAAGKHTQVNVEMKLTAAPGIVEDTDDDSPTGGEAGVAILGADGLPAQFLNDPIVTVRLRLTGATTVVMANDPALSRGVTEKKVADLEKVTGAEDLYLWKKWDLNGGMAVTGPVDEERSVFVQARNDLGYASGIVSASVVYDTVPPTLVNQLIDPAAAKSGTMVRASFSFTEPVAAITLSDGGLALDCVTDNDQLFVCSREITAAIDDGPYPITVSATDRAGNENPGLSVGAVTVDSHTPELLSSTATPRLAKALDMIDFTLEFSEEPAADPDIRIGDSAVTGCTHEGTNYACSYSVTGDEPEGTKLVTCEAADAAGNILRTDLGAVTFDFTPPQAIGEAALRLFPAPDSPLTAVAKATNGARIELAFTLSEKVYDGDGTETIPAVALLAAGHEQELTGSVTGNFYLYTATIDGFDTDEAAGGFALINGPLADAAGNPLDDAFLTALTLTLDTHAPAAPAVATENKIVYSRIPWGIEATGGVATYTVRGGAAAVEPQAVVIAYDQADLAVASEIGRSAADADGAFGAAPGTAGQFALSRADRTTVYLAAMDDAGNRSAPVAVRDVAWTATLGGKVPGSLLENPSVFTTTAAFAPTLDQEPGLSVEPGAAQLARLTLRDGDSLTVGTAPRWFFRRADGTAPSSRTGHGMAYDGARGKIVVSSGFDVWEWDGGAGRWLDRTPTGEAPTGQDGWGLVYDTLREKHLLFHQYAWEAFSDFWEWDPYTGLWAKRYCNTALLPSYRAGHAIAYDAARGRVMVFGGGNGPGRNDLWELDPATGVWTDRTPATGDMPVGRFHAALVFDPGRKKLILFGGAADGYNDLNDIWEWDPATGLWSDRTVPGTGPDPRSYAAAAWDEERQRLVLYGGFYYKDNSDYHADGDLWEWEPVSGSWEKRVVLSVTDPGERGQTRLVYDRLRKRTVLFGGSLNDIWEWDGAAAKWTDRTPDGIEPPARTDHAAAYDSLRGRIVIFGGYDGTADRQDTWVFDTATGRWSDRSALSGVTPEARASHTIAYDSDRDRVVLFGGNAATLLPADLWEWDPATDQWEKRTPAGSVPEARTGHVMVYDPDRERTIVYGGVPTNIAPDVWEWNGETAEWTSRAAAANPGIRTGAAALYDTADSLMLLFEGVEYDGSNPIYRDDTWTWNGATGEWTQRTLTGMRPWSRLDHAVAWDAARSRAALIGGGSSGQPFGDLWFYDPAADQWSLSAVSGQAPEARDQAAFLYDAQRDRLLLYGGRDANYHPKSGVWELIPGAAERPAALWRIAFGSAQADTAAEPVSFSVSATVGGTGAAGNGAQLSLWDAGAAVWYRPADGDNDAATDAPAQIALTLDDPAMLRRILHGESRAIELAILPVADSGTGAAPATVAVDALEATLQYRLP